jgi:hypothetical protein
MSKTKRSKPRSRKKPTPAARVAKLMTRVDGAARMVLAEAQRLEALADHHPFLRDAERAADHYQGQALEVARTLLYMSFCAGKLAAVAGGK